MESQAARIGIDVRLSDTGEAHGQQEAATTERAQGAEGKVEALEVLEVWEAPPRTPRDYAGGVFGHSK